MRGLQEVVRGKFYFARRIDLLRRLFNSKIEEERKPLKPGNYSLREYGADEFEYLREKYRKAHKNPKAALV